jgi:hypothetical protein
MSVRAEQENKQIREWRGDFGRAYTDRNTLDPSALDALWLTSARILEVGCNVSNQLLLLRGMGYSDLHGIEIQSYAVRLAQTHVRRPTWLRVLPWRSPFPMGISTLSLLRVS